MPQKDASEGPHNFGVRLASDGNSSDKLQCLIEKGQTLGKILLPLAY